LNQHCISGPKSGKVCSAMTASEFSASGEGGGSGSGKIGSRKSSGGQINAAQAGIKEVEGSRSVSHGDALPPQ